MPRRGRRHHRPQRRGQEHAAEDPLPDHRADDAAAPIMRGRVGVAARGRHRLPPRADRPREHLPQRRDPRHDAGRDRAASSTRSSPSPRSSSSSTRRSSATRSGMYVRLAFAVAAHLEPEILIVDEVLAVGDAEFQKKCLGKMRDVASARAAPCCSSATTWRRSGPVQEGAALRARPSRRRRAGLDGRRAVPAAGVGTGHRGL